MPDPTPKAKDVGQALIDFQATLSGYGTPNWWPVFNDGPTYPDNPYTDLPRLLLKFVIGVEEPGPPQAGLVHDATYQYKWTYQRRQIPGQSNHSIMTAAMDAIRAPYLREGFVIPQIEAVPGFKFMDFKIDAIPMFTDMPHPLTNDPQLNVSTAEFNIFIKGHLTGCVD